MEAGRAVKEALGGLEAGLSALQAEMQAEGQRLPNMTHADAPRGDESKTVTMRTVREGRGREGERARMSG